MTNSDNPYNPSGQQPPENTPDGPPQYGQRSPNWQPTPPQPSGQENSGPWPVYTPGAGPNYQQPPQGPSYGGPYVPAGMPYGQGQPGGQMQPPGKLPGRGWPIFTIVAGAVAAIIIAPMIFFISILTGLDIDAIASGNFSTYNGGPVTVDQTGSVAVMPQNQETPSSCLLTGDSGEYTLYPASDTGLVSGWQIEPGEYTIDCDVAPGTPLYVFNGDQISGVVKDATTGLIWSSIIGIAGIVAVIAGIVWLVSRNRQRREMQRMQWGMPRY